MTTASYSPPPSQTTAGQRLDRERPHRRRHSVLTLMVSISFIMAFTAITTMTSSSSNRATVAADAFVQTSGRETSRTTTTARSLASALAFVGPSTTMHPGLVRRKINLNGQPLRLSSSSTTTTEESSSSATSSESSVSSSFSTDDKEIKELLPSEDDHKSLRKILNVVDGDHCFNRTPWIIGHRGCLYDELENTREGFQRCSQMGCDAVELDVFKLKCDELVVFHGGGSDENPGDLWDYCRIDGSILDYTYQEALEQLRFNPEYEEFPCPRDVIVRGSIPTLLEVLKDAKQSGLHVKIELKGPGVVEPVLKLVDSLDMIDQISFSSFDLSRLALLRKLKPDRETYKTGALFNEVPDDFIEQALAVGATEVHLRYDTITVENIRRIHSNGMGSMAWLRGPIGMKSDCAHKYLDVGNEDDAMYEVMLRTGVQQMCVNRPDVLIELRRRLTAAHSAGDDDTSETK